MTSTLTSMMTLEEALAKRFTDLDEIKDIARMGCSGGVADFIYYSETKEFFFKYQDEIEEFIDEYMGHNWLAELASQRESVTGLINDIVWVVIEYWCELQAGLISK